MSALLVATGLVLTSSALIAHHSAAMFDDAK
jgi:hypothetical protein